MRTVKKQITALSTAILIALGGMAISVPQSAHAFDWLGGVTNAIAVGSQYSKVNQQIAYLDGKGRTAYMQQVKAKYGVCADSEANALLRSVMRRLQNAIATDEPKIREKPYAYFVNNDTSFNAFCTVGHNVSVNIGLFKMLNYNEDEVAVVVAHELSHGQNNDPVNGLKKEAKSAALASLVMGGAESSLTKIGAYAAKNIYNAKFVTLPMEKKADRFAFIYTAKAGYNPGAGAATWQKVLEKSSGSSNALSSLYSTFFGDHPGHKERLKLYAKRLTEYSGGVVNVDTKGTIYLGQTAVGMPAATSSMSSLERAYLIAGNCAKVYHELDSGDTLPKATFDGSSVYLGEQQLFRCTNADDGATWAQRINAAQRKVTVKADKSITG